MKKHYRLTEAHEIGGTVAKPGSVHLLDEDHPATKHAEELDDKGLPVKAEASKPAILQPMKDDNVRPASGRLDPSSTPAPARAGKPDEHDLPPASGGPGNRISGAGGTGRVEEPGRKPRRPDGITPQPEAS